nr:hypothetical protein [Tanacetum cinerariifolium]
MNQNLYEPNLCYNSISSGFDQFQPSQFPVIHQPPQEMNSEMLHARENLMEVIQAFLKKYDHIPPREKCMTLLLAEERFLKVKQALEEGQNQPKNVQELLLKLLNDLQILNKIQLKQEDQAAKICTPYWKCPIFDNDDDEEYFKSSSPKFDSLFEEFSGELAHIDLISPEIDEVDFDPDEEILLVEKLLFDNSSARPPKELNSKNSDVVIESFSPSLFPVEGGDSLMEEIDIFLAPDDSIPPGIKNDDYDSGEDILVELLNNDFLSLTENESFHFDRYYDPSSPCPPAKPSDDDEIYFDIEPDTRILTVKVVDDISERYILKPRILPTQTTLSLCPMIDTLFPFSLENENKVFNPCILASKEKKPPHLLSHRGFKAFLLIFDFSKSPMMIYGGNIPILDVPFLHLYPP